MKMILSGNEAVARGCYEAGVKIATAYPGTPSTEILENMTQYPQIYSEWCPNEKVAFEVAMGASFEGARALVAMKHVGLNVAADPFMSVSLIGAPGGLIVVSADDPGMHSSQNEQDNRYYAKFAGYPCLEPSDSQEAKDFIREGLEISIQYDVPVMLRMTTRICHSKGVVECHDRIESEVSGFQKNPEKFVVLPAHARVRHRWAIERLEKLQAFAEESSLNTIEEKSTEIGIVTAGVTYQYVKEVMPEASIFKLGMTYPLPMEKIRNFSSSKKHLLVIEELESFIEEQVKAAGIKCEGKKFISNLGELSPDAVAEDFVMAGFLEEKPEAERVEHQLPRPPIFCPGCPHRAVYYTLNHLNALVTTDIGCYTLGVLPPLNSGDTCIEMGASIGVAVGMAKARGNGKGIVATIGDSTFLHSGMTGLLNAVNDKADITVAILDNSITAMTGGQFHPGTGKHLNGQPSQQVDFIKLCESLGIKRIKVVDSYDLAMLNKVFKEEMEFDGLSVIITNRPCALYPPENRKRVRNKPFYIDLTKCIGCHKCFYVSCPAISASDELTEKKKTKSHIDPLLCTGCSICAQVCPVHAIIQEE